MPCLLGSYCLAQEDTQLHDNVTGSTEEGLKTGFGMLVMESFQDEVMYELSPVGPS